MHAGGQRFESVILHFYPPKLARAKEGRKAKSKQKQKREASFAKATAAEAFFDILEEVIENKRRQQIETVARL